MKTSTSKYNWQRWSVEFIATVSAFKAYTGFSCHKRKFTALAGEKNETPQKNKPHEATI